MSLLSRARRAVTSVVRKVVSAATPTPTRPAGIKNIVETVKAAVTGQGVRATTSSPTLNKVLSTAASHPFLTAAAVAVPASSAGRAAVSKVTPVVVETVKTAGKAVASGLGKAFIASPVTTTAGVLIGTPLLLGAISKEPSIVTEIPKAAFSAGQDLVTAVEKGGKGIMTVIEEHPVASAVVGSVAGGLAAYEILKTPSDEKIKELASPNPLTTNGLPTVPAGVQLGPTMPENAVVPVAGIGGSPIPLTPSTQIVGKQAGSLSKFKYRRRERQQTQRQSVRVNIFNQSRLGGKYINQYRYASANGY